MVPVTNVYELHQGPYNLLCLLNLDATTWIGYLDVELRRTIDDGDAFAARHTVCYLCAINTILHHENFQLIHVVNEELVEAIGQHMSGLLV